MPTSGKSGAAPGGSAPCGVACGGMALSSGSVSRRHLAAPVSAVCRFSSPSATMAAKRAASADDAKKLGRPAVEMPQLLSEMLSL